MSLVIRFMGQIMMDNESEETGDPLKTYNASEDIQLQAIHQEMINYLLFLQNQSKQHPTLSIGMQKAWFSFPEVKQTWLGFSLSGNAGRGMGGDFAKGLYEGLNSVFKDFDKITVTKGLHMEKLCLISPRVGRDKISDFTTSFVKRYLLEYTEKFARTYLPADKCRLINVPKVNFSWETLTWVASNKKLKQNLANQVDVYQAASNTDRAIKVILYFSKDEEQKIFGVLNELHLAGSDDIVLIDARNDNKPSASNARTV